jgi:hypothetical protein
MCYTVNVLCIIYEMNEIYSEENVGTIIYLVCVSFLRKCVRVSRMVVKTEQ